LEELSKERDAYINFEREITRNRDALKARGTNGNTKTDGSRELGGYDIEGGDEEWEELSRRKIELQKEEEDLIKVLAEKEAELGSVRQEEKAMKQEEEAVDKEETE